MFEHEDHCSHENVIEVLVNHKYQVIAHKRALVYYDVLDGRR